MDTDGQSPIDEGVTVKSCMIKHSFSQTIWALLVSLNNMYLIGFLHYVVKRE